MNEKNDWPIKEIDGLKLVFSPLLSEFKDLTHAFTTRHGGQSKKPLDSFNLGRHILDQESCEDAVLNRKKLCNTLGFKYDSLMVPKQVHSAIISIASIESNQAEVDSLATTDSAIPILLHYADCVPIILFEKNIKAICVIHAGWRGTASRIAYKAVKFIEQELKGDPKQIIAAIGPAIGSCCYEVSQDVHLKLELSLKEETEEIQAQQSGKKYHCDLKAINASQLSLLGIRNIDISSFCTACHPDLFYSHRFSGGNTGRQGAIACLH